MWYGTHQLIGSHISVSKGAYTHACSNDASWLLSPEIQIPWPWDRTLRSAFLTSMPVDLMLGGPGPPFEKVKCVLHRQNMVSGPVVWLDMGELTYWELEQSSLPDSRKNQLDRILDHTRELCKSKIHREEREQQLLCSHRRKSPGAVNFS